MMPPETSVIILNWNTARDTIECLESMKGQTYKDFEIVLVDNFSREDDYTQVADYVKKNKNLTIKLFRMKSNLGFTGGNNVGIKRSKGRYLCFLNNDTIVDKDFLKELVLPLKRDQSVGATTSKLLFYKDGPTNILQHAGSKLTYYGMMIDEGIGKTDSKRFSIEKEDEVVHGASFMVSRDALRKIKEPFCEYYFIYFEEVDLSWRIRSAGFKIMYAPKSVVYHKGSVSIKVNKKVSRQDMMTIRNKYLTFYRNLPVLQFTLVFPLIFLYDLGRVAKHLVKGNPMFLINFTLGFSKFLHSTNKVRKPRAGDLSELRW